MRLILEVYGNDVTHICHKVLCYQWYINHIYNILKHLNPILFADDSNPFYTVKDNVIIECQKRYEICKNNPFGLKWINSIRMSRTPHYILFISKRKLTPASIGNDGECASNISKATWVFLWNQKPLIMHAANTLSASLSFAMLVKAKCLICKRPLLLFITHSYFQSVFDGWVMAEWLRRWLHQYAARGVSKILGSPVQHCHPPDEAIRS